LLQVDDENGITTVGQIDRPSAMWMTHPGAIYLHEARTFLVENLDLIAKTASMRSYDGDYYTMPRTETSVDLIQEHRSAPTTGGRKGYGEFQVHTQVLGFRKLHWDTRELLGYEPLELPATELITEGYWLSISQATIERLTKIGLWRQLRPDYGPSWNRQRNLARQRDHFKCQICGKPENDRQHDVHHKIPLRAFRNENGVIDTQKANRLENLITLCTNCHHRAESAVRIRSGIAGLSFVLANLAPLFLMCDTRDLGVHADSNSPVDDGLPTLIIYERIPAGIGFSQRLFEIHTELLSHARQLINDCACIDGCPSCVGPGGEQGEGGKQETLALLSELVG
jgi:DEAD/DEAH box helicase domain-containing protein